MRRRVLLSLGVVLVAAMLVLGPSVETRAGPPIHVTVSNMLAFPGDTGPLSGASILTRDNKGVTLNLSTANLDPGSVYTTWWVVFNRPKDCASTPCGLADLETPKVRASVLWATGFIADGTGTANVSARLERSNPPGQVLFGPGLADVNKAEIHIIVRTHGAPQIGLVNEQMSLFEGGCLGGGAPCADQQASIHLPKMK